MPGYVVMVVEIPQGSRNKYEVDNETGEIFLDRRLFTATHYPADYGFIPDTLADDGDPLDILCLTEEPTFPGCRIRVRPVGVFLMEDQGAGDHKLIGVPAGDPRFDGVTEIEDVSPHLRRELDHFFRVYKELEGKPTEVLGWQGAGEAWKSINEARNAYQSGSVG